MANNFEAIKELTTGKNTMTLTNAIMRAYGIPLDYSSVQESYDKALEYAKTNAKAYIGQPISVGDTLYIVADAANGYLKEVGSKPEGDNGSIVVGEDGKVAMYGFTAAEKATLPRKKSDGTLEWVPIDAIVTGDGNEKTRVVAAADSDITVTENYNSETDTYTYTLDVNFPAIPEYSITKEESTDKVTYKLTKDGEAVGEAIEVHKAYDDTALAGRVSEAEAEIASQGSRLSTVEGKVDGFFAAVENPDDVIDTLAEINKYIADDKDGASAMAQSIQANATAIETLNGSGTGSIQNKISVAISAQAAEDVNTYATKTALEAVSATANAAAVKTEVEAALADKADATALANYFTKSETYSKETINEMISEITGGTVDPENNVAALKARVDAHEAESAASFAAIERKNAAQDTSISANAEAIAAINNETTGVYARAVEAAGQAAQGMVNGLANTVNPKISQNTSDIAAANSQIEGINSNITTISGKVGTLETKVSTLESGLAGEIGAREALGETVAQHGTDITGLKTATQEISAAVAANTSNFANYSKTNEVAKMISDAIGEIDYKAITDAIAANTEAISTEASRADTEEKRLAGLIQGNTNAINENSAELARINGVLVAALENDQEGLDSIKELAAWVAEHETEVLPVIEANTTAIATLNGTGDGSVAKAIADAIAEIPAVPVATVQAAGLVKASDEVTVAADGKMEIGYISTDKLVAGNEVWVLNGGNSGVVTQ